MTLFTPGGQFAWKIFEKKGAIGGNRACFSQNSIGDSSDHSLARFDRKTITSHLT